MVHSILHVQQGDITKLHVDAIVNAANSSLMGGGGVDGAIHRAGGEEIIEACKKLVAKQGNCKPGNAVITTGGNLPAKFVIHTVGPVWQEGKNNEAALLANCYQNSLRTAMDNKIRSIAFPNISTGVYGYPKNDAATVVITTVKEFISNNAPAFDKIIFICYDNENFGLYQQLLNEQ